MMPGIGTNVYTRPVNPRGLHQHHINLRLRVSRWFCTSTPANADGCEGENHAETKAYAVSGWDC